MQRVKLRMSQTELGNMKTALKLEDGSPALRQAIEAMINAERNEDQRKLVDLV